ncbi:MAG: hypothetical protein M1823_006053, partial [Watsoniomyces obsoletus]
MAGTILAARQPPPSQTTVGRRWYQSFLQRHPTLQTKFSPSAKTDLRRDAGRLRQAFGQALRASTASGRVRKPAPTAPRRERLSSSVRRQPRPDGEAWSIG